MTPALFPPRLRPLRRVRPGVWRSNDERFEFVGGRSIPRGRKTDQWWDVYKRGERDGPVFYERYATLRELVDVVQREFYT
jgi:hypothetical protein